MDKSTESGNDGGLYKHRPRLTDAMALTLLLDKSILQNLSSREAEILSLHYLMNVPPVLLFEMLGNLAKLGQTDQPRRLARKFSASSSAINVDWHSLLVTSLLGQVVPMCGQIVIPLDKEIPDPDGGIIKLSDEQPAEIALRRWREGQFIQAEQIAAKHWREQAKTLPVNEIKSALDYILYLPRASSFSELGTLVNEVATHLHYQQRHLDFLGSILSLPAEIRRDISQRWTTEGHRSVYRFSPYAYHCLKCILVMSFGVESGLVSNAKRKKNRVDLEYLFYLPFAHVFSTSDKVQGELAKLLLRNHQFFVPGIELQVDLKQIAGYLDSLTPEQRRAHRLEYGQYPPNLPDSVTAKLWRYYMKPRQTHAGRPIQLEGEDLERFEEEVRQKIKLIQQVRGQS
jgi:hypothetical protein